jgi:cellulose synthase/poly-beta-1,6-N-acetylglucosamine synthase-like glycosyltransferase
MVSTDTLPAIGAIAALLKHFENTEVGAVGSRPVPTNVPNSIMGISAHILWKAHHLIALEQPKIGEMVAWRRFGTLLESATSVDEAFIEAQIVDQGLKVIYEPKAITYNHGPENFKDLLKQRKRIAVGHKLLRQKGYTVSTMDPLKGLWATLRATPKTPKGIAAWTTLTYAETLARIHSLFNKSESTVWEVSSTTKNL